MSFQCRCRFYRCSNALIGSTILVFFKENIFRLIKASFCFCNFFEATAAKKEIAYLSTLLSHAVYVFFFKSKLFEYFRSIRKRLHGVKINEAENEDGGSLRDGYVLTLNDKLRILALKEIIETEKGYTKLLQFLVDVNFCFLLLIFSIFFRIIFKIC